MKNLLFLASCLFIISCEPSVQQYTNQWYDAETMVFNTADKYPFFKDTINAQFEKAKPMWEKAITTTDEDVKKAEMKLAIALAKSGAVKRINNLEKKIAAVKLYEESFRDMPSDDYTNKTTLYITDADKLVTEGTATLSGTYTSVDSALRVFANIEKRLSVQEGRMKVHADEIKQKRQKIKQAEDAKKAEEQKMKEGIEELKTAK